jgi:DNA gyrase subunit A
MGRAACGVRGIRLTEGERVIDLIIAKSGTILMATANGYGKRTDIDQFNLQGRGGSGLICILTSERNGPQIGAVLVQDNDEIMLISNGGNLIRTKVANISVLSRRTQGVKLINLAEGERLVSLDRIESINENVSENPSEDTNESANENITEN